MEFPEVAFKEALDDAELALDRVKGFLERADVSDLDALPDVTTSWGLYRYAMGAAAGLQYVPQESLPNRSEFIERMERIHRRGHDVIATELGQFLIRIRFKYLGDRPHRFAGRSRVD